MPTMSLPSASMSGQQCHASQGSMPGEEGAGGVVMVKKKRESVVWPHGATLLLMKNYREKMHVLRDKKKSELWEIISDSVRSAGYDYSGDECNAKWRTLLQSYRKNVEQIKRTGNTSWKYFDVMHQICGADPMTHIPSEIYANDHGIEQPEIIVTENVQVVTDPVMMPPRLCGSSIHELNDSVDGPPAKKRKVNEDDLKHSLLSSVQSFDRSFKIMVHDMQKRTALIERYIQLQEQLLLKQQMQPQQEQVKLLKQLQTQQQHHQQQQQQHNILLQKIVELVQNK
ncbi:hypothetical protein Pcinc_028301 [Petrolisthes cinctipes]|uniref:Myb/SANT-like DNA-binding domain-containing protein n=1 Tax=Petrolisthes cinctipes TaxID=88211 RepID=A0AAE1F396_PETCI|nr:hypothetical protein Pcinc_028301 [Petrolisthes cinctipes]